MSDPALLKLDVVGQEARAGSAADHDRSIAAKDAGTSAPKIGGIAGGIGAAANAGVAHDLALSALECGGGIIRRNQARIQI